MTTPSKVVVVEHRRGKEIDTVVAFIASSPLAAETFCKNNTDFDDGNDWWWAIYSVEVDSLAVYCEDLHFRLPDGTLTQNQPRPQ